MCLVPVARALVWGEQARVAPVPWACYRARVDSTSWHVLAPLQGGEEMGLMREEGD